MALLSQAATEAVRAGPASRPARSTPEERKQPPGPRGRPRERAGGGLWWRRKGRSNRWGRLSPNRNGKQQKRSWRLLLGSASRGWERGGRWRGSWPGRAGLYSSPRDPAPESPPGMRVCTRARPPACRRLHTRVRRYTDLSSRGQTVCGSKPRGEETCSRHACPAQVPRRCRPLRQSRKNTQVCTCL